MTDTLFNKLVNHEMDEVDQEMAAHACMHAIDELDIAMATFSVKIDELFAKYKNEYMATGVLIKCVYKRVGKDCLNMRIGDRDELEKV